jgi:NAD+-dependent protein deacetylase sirtuin 4
MTLANWEKKRKVLHHTTQNVDSLLVKAGCQNLTELHGTSYRVSCIDCDYKLTREAMQILIKSINQNWNVTSEQIRPDNDVLLSDEQIQHFNLPKCPKCQNDRLKPDVGITKRSVLFIFS